MAKTDSFAGVKIPRSPVYGMNSMVVSGHSQASIAGLRILERGGSLVPPALGVPEGIARAVSQRLVGRARVIAGPGRLPPSALIVMSGFGPIQKVKGVSSTNFL